MATFLRATYGYEPRVPAGFSDVGGSPHEGAIGAVAREGVASGYPDGTYRPGAYVTRAQMASFLARAAGLLD
jgi:hypothetical protein